MGNFVEISTKIVAIDYRQGWAFLTTMTNPLRTTFPVNLASAESKLPPVTRVLIAAFDGLQPSQIRPDLSPNLAEFAAGGVTFARNHPAFPTVTRINVASLVTGRHPGGHGLAGNTVVMRDYDPNNILEAMEPQLARVAKQTGDVLLVPTLADILHDHGHEFVAVGVGTSGNAYVQNPRAETLGGATIHPEFCLPRNLHEEIVERFGSWPDKETPNVPQMEHGARVLTEYVLAERNPAVALIWFSEPDSSNHKAGVGSALSNRALAAADEQFGRIIEWFKRNGNLDETDVIVVSDHGYATIENVVDIETELRAAGFPSGGQSGGVLAAPNGGAALFYAHESDPSTVERLAAWLSTHPWCGALLTAERVGPVPGTLPARVANIDGLRSPDLTMSFAWDSAPNAAGFPGHTASAGGSVGVGTHGGMSQHELRNTLIARGPNWKTSTVVDTPTGNVDIAPTILHLLGLPGGDDMDGRVLHEALAYGIDPSEVETRTITHTAELADYRQEVNVATVGDSVYLDEGNRVRG